MHLKITLTCMLLPFAMIHATVTMQWVNVVDASNATDSTGYGAVSYEYRISKYEVTNSQYAEFLNAVDALGANNRELYNSNMGSLVRGGILLNNGAADGSKYEVKANMADKPVNYVSWFDAARFANWMHNGQGAADTETGVYALNGAVSGLSFSKSGGAAVWIPSGDEWYKAAYFQPSSSGGDADNYWLYPTKSNLDPTLATATATGDISNPGVNVANYDGGAFWNSSGFGNVTTVGSAGTASASYYGTFDQGGNVWEWTDEVVDNFARGQRGGAYNSSAGSLVADTLSFNLPENDGYNVGFRLASYAVPEPSRMALIGLSIWVMLLRCRRRLS